MKVSLRVLVVLLSLLSLYFAWGGVYAWARVTCRLWVYVRSHFKDI